MNKTAAHDDSHTMQVLESIRLLWERAGSWPRWADVDFMIDSRLGIDDPWAAVRKVPRGLVWGVGDWVPSESSEVGLTVAGLASLTDAAEHLRIFLDTVREAAEMLRHTPPSDGGDPLRSSDLATMIDLPAAGREKLLVLQNSIWRTTSLFRSIGGPDPQTGSWTVFLDRNELRHFRGVNTVEEYLAVASRDLGSVTHAARDSRTATGGIPTVTLQSEGSESAGSVEARSPLSGPLDVAHNVDESDPASTPTFFKTESVTTSDGATYTLFIDHLIATTPGSRVYVGIDGDDRPVAIKRVPLRAFETAKWYRDSRYAEREAIVGALLTEVDDPSVLPLRGHVLEANSFTFVYPLAETSLADVVNVVAAAKGARTLAPGRQSTASTTERRAGSPVNHDPAAAALELYGADGPDEATVRAILLELAQGLAVMHNRGVLHRDIKPENALYFDGRWQLTDLGIARLVDEATATYTFMGMGTREFMAPEIFLQQPATVRSDVYSLGCTGYALRHGRPPWEGDDTARGHRLGAPDLSAVRDQTLGLALTAMLHKDQAVRPTAEALIEMLRPRTTTPAIDRLGNVVLAVARQDQHRAIGQAKANDRHGAENTAREQLHLFWQGLQTHVRPSYPDVKFTKGQDVWRMAIGDWSLAIEVHQSASLLCPAVQLGSISLQVLDRRDEQMPLANLLALWSDGDEAPEWRIYRMAANALSTEKVPVSKPLSGQHGAVNTGALELFLEQRAARYPVTAAMVVDDLPLTVDEVVDMFTAEVTPMVDGDI